MLSAIELSSSSIRLCSCADGRVTALESWPVPEGADPIAALAACPLPGDLGKVRVLLHHDDLLLRTLTQPPMGEERLDKVVRFELAALAGEGDPTVATWHLVRSLPGDLRLLALLAKTRLIERLRQALAPSGAKLVAVGHPAMGLLHAFLAQEPDHQGVACLLDVGGRHVHIVLVKDGCLVFHRTHSPGADDLVAKVAELKGIPTGDAARLVSRLAKGSPGELHDLVAQAAGGVAAGMTAALRFARSQFGLDAFEPEALHLSGAGAQVFGFAEALKARCGLPVRLLNPFAGRASRLDSGKLDRLSALPSPWTVVLGAAQAEGLVLDALADERRLRRAFWRTQGVLRACAATAVAAMGAALVSTELGLRSSQAELQALEERLKPVLQASQEIRERNAARGEAASQLSWLDAERRPGRMAGELMAVVASIQDPAQAPVVLSGYSVAREPGQVVVELNGWVEPGAAATDSALRHFQSELQRRYPPITRLDVLPTRIDRDRATFHFRLSLADQP